jgi:hypothetical protein
MEGVPETTTITLKTISSKSTSNDYTSEVGIPNEDVSSEEKDPSSCFSD